MIYFHFVISVLFNVLRMCVLACCFFSGDQIYETAKCFFFILLFFYKGEESKLRTNMVTAKKGKEKNKGKNGSLKENNELSAGSRRTVRLCLCNSV